MNLTQLTASILARGPDRVIVGPEGTATRPRRALEDHGIMPTIIFIRDDGWTLGAPADLEGVAFAMWREEWVAFMRQGATTAVPISQYREAT